MSSNNRRETNNDQQYHPLLLLSPLVIIIGGQIATRCIVPRASTWVWAYLFVGYWLTLASFIVWGGGRRAISRWLHPSQGGLGWPFLALAFSFGSTLWMAIPNWRLFLLPGILLPSIGFALLNPCLEEAYWRGLILDLAAKWPRSLSILYSSVLFAINHLFLMVFVIAARNPAVLAYQLVLGLLLGVTYTKTNSLRWPIVIHAAVNMFSLPVATFLNLYIPGMSN